MTEITESGVVQRTAAQQAADQIRQNLQKVRPFANGTVATWTRVSVDGKHWTYAAVFADGYWRVTCNGKGFPTRCSHDEFLALITQQGHAIIELGIVSETTPIELSEES